MVSGCRALLHLWTKKHESLWRPARQLALVAVFCRWYASLLR